MKKCFKCGIVKRLSEFYKHPGMKDGHVNKCITCSKADVNISRRNNIDYYREYDRLRGQTEKRKKLSIERTAKRRMVKDGYIAAHSAVARALKKGILKRKSCCMCKSMKNVHAHHDDYHKPLDVMWLCVIHHKSRHAFLEYINEDTF